MLWVVGLGLVLAACGRIGFAPQGGDAGGGGGGTPTTLTQTQSETIAASGTTICIHNNLNGDNRYFRVFDLAAAGITGTLHVTSVTFGIQSATSQAGTQPIDVRLDTLAGALKIENLTNIASTTLNIPDETVQSAKALFDTDITAGALLVAELHIADSNTDTLVVGSNTLGQTAPAYLAAPQCNQPEPIDVTNLGFANMDLVLAVHGDVR